MFRSVEQNKDLIFVTLCKNATNIQSCPLEDMKTIFNGSVPNGFWFDLAYLLEKGAKCSGIRVKLDVYYFSDKK